MRLTAAQVAAYASGAGFPSSEIPTATAVALAEHGGDVKTDALGDVSLQSSKWGPSVGIWQIRSLTPAYLAKASGTDKLRDQTRLVDPTFNAAAARAIWAAKGWQPWSTYPGAYLLWLPSARAAAKAPAAVKTESAAAAGSIVQAGFLDDAAGIAGDVARGVVLPLNVFGDVHSMLDAAKNAVGLLGNLLAFVAKAAAWLGNPDNWSRVLKVLVGWWMVLLGLLMFGWPAISKAADFIPAGKAAKAAGAAKKAAPAAAAAAGAA